MIRTTIADQLRGFVKAVAKHECNDAFLITADAAKHIISQLDNLTFIRDAATALARGLCEAMHIHELSSDRTIINAAKDAYDNHQYRNIACKVRDILQISEGEDIVDAVQTLLIARTADANAECKNAKATAEKLRLKLSQIDDILHQQ